MDVAGAVLLEVIVGELEELEDVNLKDQRVFQFPISNLH